MNARTKTPMRTVLRLLAAALLAGVTGAHAQNAATESRIIQIAAQPGAAPHQLSLSLNKAAIIELDRDARDVVVANPAIVDAVVRTPRRIFILSLSVGQTNAIFLDAQGRQITTLEIAVSADVNDLNSALLRQLPETAVRATSINDSVVLGGSADSVQEASAAQQMATRVTNDPDKVVNNIGLASRQQVLIRVSVSEMQRSVAKQLGVDVTAAVNTAGVPMIASTSNPFSLLGRALSDLSGVQVGQVCTVVTLGTCVPGPNNVQGVMRALERVGLVRTLAEPNLTAVSGEAARFLAGGEFPVPVSRDQYGNIIVEFKQFGVGLGFTPVVLNEGRISLQVSTEVSELTTAGALTQLGSTRIDDQGNIITTAGLTIPALAVRRADTTVELPSGGSLMIGGLLQQTNRQNIDAFPGLKELPVLGALFRSRDFQNFETELVIIVTAYLVDPVAETQLAMPDQGFSVPTDVETILMGRLNSVYGRQEPASAAVPPGTIGYIVE